MKSALLIVALLVSGSSAMAAKKGIYRSELTKFDISPDLQLAGRVDRGSVVVDYSAKTVTLNLLPRFYCPKNAFCAEVMPANYQVELPIVSVKQAICGIEITALEDLRMVDGNKTTLTILDATHPKNGAYCKLAAMTSVNYEIIHSGFGGTSTAPIQSYFYGDRLEQVIYKGPKF